MQVLKFISVGVINTGVDFLVLNVLIWIFPIDGSTHLYTFFKAISFLAAVINSYVMNKYWVFSETQRTSKLHEGFLFLIVSGIGFVLNVAISTFVFSFVTNTFQIGHHIGANIGALVGSVLVLFWNFIGYKLFVFKKQ